MLLPTCLALLLPGVDISTLINEVDAVTPGSPDTLEFVELYDNPGVSLDGWALVVYDGATDTVSGAWDLDGYTINAAGYFVAGGAALIPPPDLVLPDDALPDSGAVAIYLADAVDFPIGSPIRGDGLWEAIVYAVDDPGLAILGGGEPAVDEDALGNAEGHSSQRTPNGADQISAQYLFAQGRPTPGAQNSPLFYTEAYCIARPNSVHPAGARLRLLGSGSVAANDSEIVAERVPDHWGYFAIGRFIGEPKPFGDGALCLKWPYFRSAPVPVHQNVARLALDLDLLLYEPGANQRWLHFVYRDTQGSFINTSLGLRVVFTP
jgi:hypothetical protein